MHSTLRNYFCGGIEWLGIWDICRKQDTLCGSLHNSAGLTLPVAEATAWDCFSGLVKGRKKTQTPAFFKLISIMFSVTMLGAPCAKTQVL